jgi:two-component system, sensor histidine kinase and response regulator
MPKTPPNRKYRLLAEVVLLLAAAVLLSHLARSAIGLPRESASDFLLDGLLLAMLCLPPIWWRITGGRPTAERGDVPRPATGLQRSRVLVLMAILAFFVAGAGLSVWLAWRLSLEVRADAMSRFEAQANLLEEAVINRFEMPLQALRGLGAMHALEQDFASRRFREYWAARGFNRDFPGVRGFGYIAYVPPERFDAFLAAERRDQGREFEIKTLGPVAERYVIKLVEPLEDNRAAIGLDIGSERVRRTAAEEAARSGQPALTGVITLVQDGSKGPGFLLLLPVYRKGSSLETEGQRMAALQGFVYSPLVAEELFKPLLMQAQGQVHFDLEVRSPHDPPLWAFQSDRFGEAASKQPSLLNTDRYFMFAGMEFRLQVRTTRAFETSVGRTRAWVLGMGGVALSAMLSFVFWLLASGRSRAETLAVRLTGELHRLAAIARRTHDAVIITDPTGRVTWVNEAYTRVTGYTLEESRGRKPGEMLQSDQTDPATVATIRQQLLKRESCHVEILNRHKDGTHYWLDLDIQPLLDDSGTLTGFMAVERDITQRREAQQRERSHSEQLAAALRETDALMKTIERHAIVSEAGPDGRILRVNDAFNRISGYSKDELIGQDHRMINSGHHDQEFWVAMWRTIASGQPWRGQICDRAKDGSLYWTDSIIAPFVNESGEIEKYVSIRFDITQARQNEAELARERQRLQTTLEGTKVGTWEVNILTGESRVDERWARMLGYTLEELSPVTPATWKALTHPEEETVAQSRLLDYLHGKSAIFEIERRLLHKQGHWIWVLSRGIVSTRRGDGQVEWMSGTHMEVTERHKLQDELQHRNDLMSAIIENLPGGLSVFDGNLNLVLRNSRFASLLNLPDSLLAQQPTTFENIIRFNAARGEYGTGDREQIVAAVVERARHPVAHVMERTRPDGSTLEVRGRPLPGGGFVTTYTDITQRKQAEQEARRADEMLRQAINTLDEAFVIYDAQDRLLMCNQRYKDTYPIAAEVMRPGISFEEIIRYGAERGEYAAAIGRVDDWVAERMRQHLSANTDIVQQLGDGRYLRIVERKTSDGFIVGFRIDISALVESRNAAQAATRASEQALARLQAIYDVLPVGLTITDPQGHIVDCNPASERLLGITKAEHLARNYDGREWTILREDGSVMPPGEYASVIALTQRRAVQDTVMQVVTPRRKVWLSVSAMPMDNSELGVVVAYVDITEARNQRSALIEAKQTAEEASRSKSQFLANMSHEIRTPMNAILGMLGLLQNTELTVRQQDYVGKTEGAATSLLGLLNDILDFSKVEAGKMTLEATPFRIDRLLRDLSVILSSNVGDKKLEVLFDIDPRLPAMLVGDSLRLKQVLINLGGNAIKFTGQGMVVVGIVVLSLQPDRVTLEVSVRDTGIGIAPENLQRIFEGFSQAEASTTRRFGGTGLGLAISARLVGLMGGQLQVESELGQGSRFHFQVTLPMAPDSVPAIKPPEETALRELRVLVIDDNPTARDVMKAMATPMGWQVDLAASGEEGLSAMRDRMEGGRPAYDAVFVDWQMPGMDGWQTTQRIRALLQGRESPILVMVTAHGREMLSSRTADEQALLSGFLVKPVTPSMLLEAVIEARQARSGARGSTPRNRSERRLQGMRVLVVEDNKVNQQVAQELLEREGARVTLADNGALAVQAIDSAIEPWHVVLMDVQMPVMDGYTATRKLRQELKLTDLPVIAMTANAMESDKQDALAAGMNAHVGKPFKLDELVQTMLEHSGFVPQAVAASEDPDTSPLQPAAAELPAGTAELDIAAAAERLGGDISVLLRVLQSYARDLPGVPQELGRLLAAGADNDARRLLHTLKGTSATVGASRLAALAAEGEQRLRDGPLPDGPQAQVLVANVEAGAKAVMADLEPILHRLQAQRLPAHAAASPLDRAQLARDLSQLEELLQSSDLACLDVYARLRDQHGAALQQELDALDEAMAALDFEQAVSLCRTLQQRYTA